MNKKAYIAGLLHDVAKGKCRKGLKKIAQQYSVDIDEFESINPELIHGKLGAKMVEIELGVDDEDILNAICWHTTGRENMSMLEKIVYIADLTEPGRDFENIRNAKNACQIRHRLSDDKVFKRSYGFCKEPGFHSSPKQ